MKKFELKRQQFVPRPLNEVFPFFERPENLAIITPRWLGFRILTPKPIPMKEGTVIEYSIKVMGIRMNWASRISLYDPPRTFADEQLKGPYASWIHTHRFVEVDGGTLISDEIHYSLPFGVIGIALHGMIVRRHLQSIFNHRARVIEQMFGHAETVADMI